MDANDVRAIAAGLRAIIERTLAYDQAMIRTKGKARPPFRIYGRAKEPCPRCGTTLRAIAIGGRGTVFCPGCQRRHAPA